MRCWLLAIITSSKPLPEGVHAEYLHDRKWQNYQGYMRLGIWEKNPRTQQKYRHKNPRTKDMLISLLIISFICFFVFVLFCFSQVFNKTIKWIICLWTKHGRQSYGELVPKEATSYYTTSYSNIYCLQILSWNEYRYCVPFEYNNDNALYIWYNSVM